MLKNSIVTLIILSFSAVYFYFSETPTCHHQHQLKIASNTWLGYEPFYLAEQFGAFKDKDLRMVRLGTATQVMRAYRSKQVDIALLTIDEALKLHEINDDFKIVMVTDISNGADALIADKSIKQLSDLKGKTVLIERTALGTYILQRALEKASLNKEDITIQHAEVYQHAELFITNPEIDAVITFEPSKSLALQKRGHVLLDSSDLENEIIDVLIVRNSVLTTHRERIKSIFYAWKQGYHKTLEASQATLTTLSQSLKLSPSEIKAAYKELKLAKLDMSLELLKKDGIVENNLKRTQALLVEEGFLKELKDLDHLIDNKLLEEL